MRHGFIFAVLLGMVAMTGINIYYPDIFKKMNDNLIFAVFLTIVFGVFVIIEVINAMLSSHYNTGNNLTMRIINCPLRRQRGLNYCAICPDGYKCAAGDK